MMKDVWKVELGYALTLISASSAIGHSTHHRLERWDKVCHHQQTKHILDTPPM